MRLQQQQVIDRQINDYIYDLLYSHVVDYGWHTCLSIFHEILSQNILFSNNKTLPKVDNPYEHIQPCFWWAQLLFILHPEEVNKLANQNKEEATQSFNKSNEEVTQSFNKSVQQDKEKANPPTQKPKRPSIFQKATWKDLFSR